MLFQITFLNFFLLMSGISAASVLSKRDAAFLQTYNHQSSATNVAGGALHGAQDNFYQNYNHNSHATNIAKRDADAQFAIQNYGGTNTNYDCKYGGCAGETTYNQQYHHGSSANNYDLGKRDADFVQNYNHQSSATNVAGGYPHGVAGVYPAVAQGNFYQNYNHNAHATNIAKRDADFVQNYNHNSHATNIAKRDADFVQNYNHQSSATNVAGGYPRVSAGVYPAVAQGNFYQNYNHNSHATNIAKRDADAQFNIKNYGGTNTNYDCKYGGCGSTIYNQQYHHGSSANNYDHGKRDADFYQNYNHQSSATNIAGRK